MLPRSPEAMRPSFDVPIVGAALGHSPVYDEWKGDFAAARAAADAALRAANEATRVEAWIARGLVHLLQGEIVSARELFRKVQEATPGDNRALIALAYDELGAMCQYRLSPAGGLLSAELEQRWHALAFSGEQETRWSQLVSHAANDANLAQASVVHHVLMMQPVHQQMLDARHGTLRPEQADQFLGMLVQQPLRLRQVVERSGGSPGIVGLLESVVADYAARAGKADLARGTFGQAYQHYEQDGDLAGMARCLTAAGDGFAAPLSSPTVWNLLLQESSSESSALTWRDEARESLQAGIDVDKAAELYAAALELFQQVGSMRAVAALDLRQAWLAVHREDFAAACRALESAIERADACGDVLMSGVAQISLGLARVGVATAAEDHRPFEQIGAWGATSGSVAFTLGLGRFASRVARHFVTRRGDYERARACYRLCRTLFGSLGLPFAESQILADLAELHRALGDRPTARVYYGDALTAHRRAAVSAPGLGQQIRRVSIDVAIRLYRLAEDERDAAGIERALARLGEELDPAASVEAALPTPVPIDLAASPEVAGELDLGAIEARMAAVTHRFVTETIELGRVTAACYRAVEARDAGRAAESDAMFLRALTDARSSTVASTDQLQAVVFAHQRRFDEAAEAYSRALAAQRDGTDLSGQLVAAMQHSPVGDVEARMQRQRLEEQAATFMLRLRKYDQARRHFRRLGRLAGPRWWRRNEAPWESLSDLGEVAEGLGHPARALVWYDAGLEQLRQRRAGLGAEELRIATASQRGSRFLHFYAARAALELKHRYEAAGRHEDAAAHGARAFRYLELGRARTLLDLMATPANDREGVREARRLRARIATWNSVLASQLESNGDTEETDDVVRAYRKVLSEDSEALREIEARVAGSQRGEVSESVIDLGSLTGMLDDETCLVEYAYAGDDLLVMAVNRHGIAASARLAIRAGTLDVHVSRLQDACRGCVAVESAARDLEEWLLKPLAPALSSSYKLMIVADKALHRVPFQVLRHGSYLLGESHLITYLPSASALRFIEGTSRAPGSIFAIGNPPNMAYERRPGEIRRGVPQLKGAELEVRVVAKQFAETVPVDSATKKAAVLEAMPTYRNLHFATHAHLDPDTPQRSGLLLAEGEIMTVQDLAGLRLDADLVVLSACDTAGGAITGGNDIIGLSHAFLAAGARALVVSLWPVDDWSATVTMKRFYDGLRAKQSPAQALAGAQRAVKDMTAIELEEALRAVAASVGHSEDVGAAATVRAGSENLAQPCSPQHPMHWAPFILIGTV